MIRRLCALVERLFETRVDPTVCDWANTTHQPLHREDPR